MDGTNHHFKCRIFDHCLFLISHSSFSLSQTHIEPLFILFFDCSEGVMEERLLGRNEVSDFLPLILSLGLSYFMSNSKTVLTQITSPGP